MNFFFLNKVYRLTQTLEMCLVYMYFYVFYKLKTKVSKTSDNYDFVKIIFLQKIKKFRRNSLLLTPKIIIRLKFTIVFPSVRYPEMSEINLLKFIIFYRGFHGNERIENKKS